jgi:hypothetical protein
MEKHLSEKYSIMTLETLLNRIREFRFKAKRKNDTRYGNYADVKGGRVFVGDKVMWSYSTRAWSPKKATIVSIDTYNNEDTFLRVLNDDPEDIPGMSKRNWTIRLDVNNTISDNYIVKLSKKEEIILTLKQ